MLEPITPAPAMSTLGCWSSPCADSPPVLDEEVAIGGATMPRGREQQEKRRWVVLAVVLRGRGWIRWQTLVDEAAARLLVCIDAAPRIHIIDSLSLSLSLSSLESVEQSDATCE